MKNVYIDFNTKYYLSDFKYENVTYSNDIQRIVFEQVKEVGFKNNYINVTYKSKNHKKGIDTMSFDLRFVKNFYVN